MNEPPARTLHTRREFLHKSMLGAAAAWTLPVFIQNTFSALEAMAAESPYRGVTGKDAPILVVLQLAGGNDGLNTLVPYADDAYFRARTRLGIPARNVLKLNDSIGLNPGLSGMRSLYDAGAMAIVQGVGYPNPNRSHFRSTEIWQTASDAGEYRSYGWLGRYFDSCCRGEDPTVCVSIGRQRPQAFASANPTGISLARPESYRWNNGGDDSEDAEAAFLELNCPEGSQMKEENAGGSIEEIGGAEHTKGSPLDFLQRVALDAQLSSDRILEIAKKSRSDVQYPKGNLGSSLHLVGRMIAGGFSTRVYYVNHGGYDTHSRQNDSHSRLMRELDAAVSAFCRDMKAQGNFERVTLMTFSEFGRRVSENASGGTDHGAAAPMFLFGGGLKPGLFGKYPSLTDLERGDLIFNVDFRSVYATVLEQWLGTPGERVLGRKFATLPIFG